MLWKLIAEFLNTISSSIFREGSIIIANRVGIICNTICEGVNIYSLVRLSYFDIILFIAVERYTLCHCIVTYYRFRTFACGSICSRSFPCYWSNLTICSSRSICGVNPVKQNFEVSILSSDVFTLFGISSTDFRNNIFIACNTIVFTICANSIKLIAIWRITIFEVTNNF